VEVWLYYFFNLSGSRKGGWPMPAPGRFTSRNDPAPIVQETASPDGCEKSCPQ